MVQTGHKFKISVTVFSEIRDDVGNRKQELEVNKVKSN